MRIRPRIGVDGNAPGQPLAAESTALYTRRSDNSIVIVVAASWSVDFHPACEAWAQELEQPGGDKSDNWKAWYEIQRAGR